MSLVVQVLQLACVAALEEAQPSFKVFDSMVDPRDLREEAQPIAVVSVTDGRIAMDGKAFMTAIHTVDLCIDFAIARKVLVEITEGEGETAQQITVEFPDNGAGHDFVLRTTAYEAFCALQAENGTWAEIFRATIANHDENAPSTWERGVAADQGIRLGILRYTFKLQLIDDPTPGEAIEAGTYWAQVLDAMTTNVELADKAKLWRALIEKPSLPEWRRAQAAMGITIAGIIGSGIGPVDGSTTPPSQVPTAATQITVDDQDDGTAIVVGAGEANLVDGAVTTPIVEVPPA